MEAGLNQNAELSQEATAKEKMEWKSLPPHVLVNIFSHLDQGDRSRCARVSKAWNDAFYSISLWKNPVFHFKLDKRERLKASPSQFFINRCGKFFKKLTICYKKHGLTTKTLKTQIVEFFKIINEEEMQLESIEFPKLLKIFLGNRWKSDDFKELLIFMKKQKFLKDVNLNNLKASVNCGFLVLEHLIPETVEHLNVQKYFHSSRPIVESERFIQALSQFSNLRELCLNYNYLSQILMERFSTSLCGQLEKFNILRQRRSSSFELLLTNNNWIRLKKRCPKLNVSFAIEMGYFEITDEVVANRGILLPAIPLTKIHLMSEQSARGPQSRSFNHLITHFGEKIKVAVFDMRNPKDGESGLVDFVYRCTSLEELTVRALSGRESTMQHAKDLMETMLNPIRRANIEREVALKKLRLKLRKMPYKERLITTSIEERYRQRFLEFGISLKLILKN